MGTDCPIVPSQTEYARKLPFCQCSRGHGENARNLVVCIDGTTNEFGQKYTNVVKVFNNINKTTSPVQHAHYVGGIGADPKSSHTLSCRSMRSIIEEAYGWLAEKYQTGDQIYLFGFSRGAYQARVLAAMIYEVGLTTTPMQKQVDRAYARYRATLSGKPEAKDTARRFKKLFSWNCLLRVHFVGVWDTVFSGGFARGKNFLSASSSASHACHFRHALALDESRAKFMPLYSVEINDREKHKMSEHIVANTQHVAPHTSEQRWSTVDHEGTKQNKGNIKEVWFAGSHSDVGGVDRSRRSYNAGNVSLSWMRREAEDSGLVLHPAETAVWVPSDIDFGVSGSMTSVPITHQVCSINYRRWHRLQSRRIIPGQKIHASILYANTYKPRASLGEGFEVRIVHPGLDTALDTGLWETVLFDHATAEAIVESLGDQKGVAPIYLDRLLSILRFHSAFNPLDNDATFASVEEEKQCVPRWRLLFSNLIHNRDCAPLVRLVTIVAYYEASCDSDIHPENLSPDIFHFAKKNFSAVLAARKHRDLPRVISLLRPLTKHQILRENILTQDVLETFVELLDAIIHEKGGNIRQAMDGLTCLLQCKDTKGFIVKKLSEKLPSSTVSRLSRILDVKDSHLLIAVLRMVMTLARIPKGKEGEEGEEGKEAKRACLEVKPRLRELAKTDKWPVGVLSIEILLVICDCPEQEPQSIHNANVRANVAGALIRWSPDNHDSANGEGSGVVPGLHRLFGVGAMELTDRHKRLIKKLKSDIQQCNSRKRTAATLAVLNLCENKTIRTFLCEFGCSKAKTICTFPCEFDLFSVFTNQMKHKDSALLAAYALSNCLKYDDMEKLIQDNEDLPKCIVDMFRLNYFHDAIGQVKGSQIFEDFMKNDILRKRIKDQNIIKILKTKLVKGEPKETRMSLPYLDILCALGEDGLLHRDLVAESLECLRNPAQKVQKAGVAILCALAQTERGVETIRPWICDIIRMLLPDEYFLVIQSTVLKATIESATWEQTPTTQEAVDPSLSSSCMMGLARTLRALAQNWRSPTQSTVLGTAAESVTETREQTPMIQQVIDSWLPNYQMVEPARALHALAQHRGLQYDIRYAKEYCAFKYLYLSPVYINRTIRPLRNHAVIDTLDKMIKAIDVDSDEFLSLV